MIRKHLTMIDSKGKAAGTIGLIRMHLIDSKEKAAGAIGLIIKHLINLKGKGKRKGRGD